MATKKKTPALQFGKVASAAIPTLKKAQGITPAPGPVSGGVNNTSFSKTQANIAAAEKNGGILPGSPVETASHFVDLGGGKKVLDTDYSQQRQQEIDAAKKKESERSATDILGNTIYRYGTGTSGKLALEELAARGISGAQGSLDQINSGGTYQDVANATYGSDTKENTPLAPPSGDTTNGTTNSSSNGFTGQQFQYYDQGKIDREMAEIKNIEADMSMSPKQKAEMISARERRIAGYKASGGKQTQEYTDFLTSQSAQQSKDMAAQNENNLTGTTPSGPQGPPPAVTGTTTPQGALQEDMTGVNGYRGEQNGPMGTGGTGVATSPPAIQPGQSGSNMPAVYQDQLKMNDLVSQFNQQSFTDDYAAAEGARKNSLLRALGGTNAATQYDLSSLSMPELEQVAMSQGLDLSAEEKRRIQAGGLAQIENIKMEKNEMLAEIQLRENSMERDYNRTLTAQERSNAQNDVTMRTLVSRFGDGGQSMVSNVAVMNKREEGMKIVRDMSEVYRDNKTGMGIQVQKVVRVATQNINMIEQAMADQENERFLQLQEKAVELINQGVTNTKDLNKVLREDINRYYTETNRIKTEGLKMFEEQQQRLFENQMSIAAYQQKEDDRLTNAYGYIMRNGMPVMGADGLPAPTLENTKFFNEVDRQRSVEEGIIYENGQPKLDANGQQIPTFSREQYDMENKRWAADYDATQAQRNVENQLAQSRINIDYESLQNAKKQNEFDNTLSLLEAGYEQGNVDPETGMIRNESGIFNTAGSKYTPYVEGDAVRFQIPTDKKTGLLDLWDAAREQCGEFVNDASGKKIMKDSFIDKMKLVTSIVPRIGAAFVQATGNQYGHTGLVERVEYNSSGLPSYMEIVDSNARGNGKVERARIDISYKDGQPTYTRNGRKVDIKGYTDSMLGTPDTTKGAMTPTDTSFIQSPGGGIFSKPFGSTGATSTSALTKIPKEAQSVVNSYITTFDNEPQVRSFQTMQNAYSSVKNLSDTTKNSADDMELIYAFAKIMDPNSAVKEGEYKTIQDYSTALTNKFAIGTQRLWDENTGFLTEQARKNMKKTLDSKFNTEKRSYQNVRNTTLNAINKAAGMDVGADILKEYELQTDPNDISGIQAQYTLPQY